MNTQLEKKVLVVDDEPDLLDIYQFRLELEGFEVVLCADAAAALKYLKTNSVGMMLSDVRMPNMSGVDLLSEVMTSFDNPPSFYLITGSLDLPIKDIYNVGGRGIFLKPLDFEALMSVLKSESERMLTQSEFSLRKCNRHDVDLEVKFESKDGASPMLSKTVNLGKGGFFTTWPSGVEIPVVGSQREFCLKYIFESKICNSVGIVEAMWVRREGAEDAPRGVGFRFTSMEEPADDFWWLLNSLRTNSFIPDGP